MDSPLLTMPPWKQLYSCEKKILIFIRIKLGMVVTCNSKYKPDEKRLKTARFPEFCGFFNPLILEISLICKYKCNSFKWIKMAIFNPVRFNHISVLIINFLSYFIKQGQGLEMTKKIQKRRKRNQRTS